MDLPLIDRIWRVRGSLALEVRRTPRDAFARLDHLFRAVGTTFRIDGDTLAFSKKDPIAQDRMAIFNHGALWVEDDGQSAELRYDLNSPTLRLCFFLPFLFLGIAWLLKESRNPAFVFAGIFTVLYVVGRILEPWLIRSAFRKSLADAESVAETAPV
ncbi:MULTISPECIES: hypothetical protein [Novosphingobium]|uniref:hypothetical protein n=1 Tax=Novosphingobium TaxID=165696 RepID=UPI0022F27A93|nr:hypothetical protein [Novosphingobium resinovorum]GLK44619.1 hypothetical protein GCM10017612_25390 [Novosphingobium resinovorum]